jgi:hypothetical protein
MQQFTLTNLAIRGVEHGRPGEALRIADELLAPDSEQHRFRSVVQGVSVRLTACGYVRPSLPLRSPTEAVSGLRVPPRIAVLARVRCGRALSLAGDHRRAPAELQAARGGSEEPITVSDPAWTWWADESELSGHAVSATSTTCCTR